MDGVVVIQCVIVSFLTLTLCAIDPTFLLVAVDCGPLNNPMNGMVALDGTTFMNEANYSCNAGYMVVGMTTRICGENGQWSGNNSTCDCEYMHILCH